MIKSLKVGAKNNQTTVAGIITMVIAILYAGKALFDGDPETSPDINSAMQAAMGIAAAIGLLFARDASKSSKGTGVG